MVRAGLLTSTCALAVVSLATIAAADTSPLTVSGGVSATGGTTAYCANSTYNLTVSAANFPVGITQYEFLDGANISTATAIGALQTATAGQDATVSWTPTTSGTHDLWLLVTGSTGTSLIGPTAVTVLDQTSPTCTPPAPAQPAVGLQNLLTSLGLGNMGAMLSQLVSSLSAQ
ncbi:hypothetical protein EBN03_03015 [Nocardia stercoris]|uniref:Ig-like domain repeat protein n=1 Tax=Nocardia stercoris TaxID=2483361 RepID=A0A3M2LFC0_9NOCA|nr:hypothetical protein EBN03_03015 [Nocardia stercoris]